MAISEHSSAEKWSKQAFERLSNDGLVPTPRNYAVYYHYCAGDTPNLAPHFEAYASKGALTQEQCNALYDKYLISESSDQAFFKDANSVIANELKKVMELLNASAKDTNQFGENLDHFTGKLSNASSIDALRDAVTKITEEARTIAAQNQKLQSELAVTSSQLNEMQENFERVHKEAHIDPLTEVGNRKYFDREIARATGEAQTENSLLSVLMVDIDHFKKFNDTHGHLVGDQVLRLVARTLVENLKGRDIIARYGGEEFIILLPQTRLQDAERVANQLRAILATKQVRKRGSQEVLGIVTISLGAAEYVPGEEADSLIGRADAAMYQAKQTGRNKVVCLAAESGSI